MLSLARLGVSKHSVIYYLFQHHSPLVSKTVTIGYIHTLQREFQHLAVKFLHDPWLNLFKEATECDSAHQSIVFGWAGWQGWQSACHVIVRSSNLQNSHNLCVCVWVLGSVIGECRLYLSPTARWEAEPSVVSS